MVKVFGKEERTGDEILLDPHTILAFKQVKKEIKQKYGYNVIDPFPKPDMDTFDFFWRLMNQTMLETREGKYLTRQALGESKVLMEIMLQKYVGYRNVKGKN